MKINDLKIYVNSSEGVFSDICTVGDFLEKYGKNYRSEIDEEGFKKQLDYLEKVIL